MLFWKVFRSGTQKPTKIQKQNVLGVFGCCFISFWYLLAFLRPAGLPRLMWASGSLDPKLIPEQQKERDRRKAEYKNAERGEAFGGRFTKDFSIVLLVFSKVSWFFKRFFIQDLLRFSTGFLEFFFVGCELLFFGDLCWSFLALLFEALSKSK